MQHFLSAILIQIYLHLYVYVADIKECAMSISIGSIEVLYRTCMY